MNYIEDEEFINDEYNWKWDALLDSYAKRGYTVYTNGKDYSVILYKNVNNNVVMKHLTEEIIKNKLNS